MNLEYLIKNINSNINQTKKSLSIQDVNNLIKSYLHSNNVIKIFENIFGVDACVFKYSKKLTSICSIDVRNNIKYISHLNFIYQGDHCNINNKIMFINNYLDKLNYEDLISSYILDNFNLEEIKNIKF